ncbi:GAF and ANTAR domain-containing protein [Actinomadura sp. DC4]|uniref:GAF and ANTAR domain-containing protein n=1 Tax=Actinomadura sp. DC4 TaxID=3055069 RepID=UPI0025B1D152|nr:GAF and ANTAR domain-containing protein [Actinomadura sp. DC4]MDN3354515.1 GAF and ANTAR domain-containing protein [Actinomadura sp. DC4]
MPTTREPALTAAFIDIADTMVVGYDLIDMAHRLAGHSVRLLDVAAAGLLLTDGQGNLGVLASSNEQAEMLELFQLQADQEGPCLECFHTGEPVTAADLPRWRDRWPGFVSVAEEQGFRTVHALPMRLRESTIGTLNLFRTGVAPLSADDLTLGQALADITTISILQERALTRSETVVEQLQGALNSRVIIEQAKGVLSTYGRISTDEAFTVLRAYARTGNRRLAEVAGAVVTDPEEARQVIRYVGTAP